jgi:hypothetical protein
MFNPPRIPIEYFESPLKCDDWADDIDIRQNRTSKNKDIFFIQLFLVKLISKTCLITKKQNIFINCLI